MAKKAAIYLGAWTAFALFFISKRVVQAGFWLGGTPLRPLLASWFLQAYAWVGLTPVVLWLGRRFPIRESRRALSVIAHLIFSVLCASLVALAVAFLAPRSGLTRGELIHSPSFARMLMYQTGFFQSLLAYWVVFCLQYASSYHLKYREQERRSAQLQVDEADLRAQLASAELTSLRRQLQPRLVFGTLDATASLVRDHRHAEGEDLLAALGDLLRCALDDPLTSAVSLDRELEHVRAYLAVEQPRFGGHVHAHVVADPATLDAAVVPASIQPIVQHAVELILDERQAAGSITIRSARVRDLLMVEIEYSTATPLVGSLPHALETLLESTRARLGGVYGACVELYATDRAGATVVTLLQPYQTMTPFTPALSREPAHSNLARSGR